MGPAGTLVILIAIIFLEVESSETGVPAGPSSRKAQVLKG
jgi:hypothetical protein